MPRYWDDVSEGEELPSFVRTTDLMHWNRYAAVNDEFIPIHMDDAAGQAAGQPAAFGMGNLRFAYLHNLLRAWLGDDGDIRRVSVQYRGFNQKHDTLTCYGKVTRQYEDEGEPRIDLEVWVENQHGQVVTPGQATVALPRRNGA